MDEEWRDIPGWEGRYQASSLGQVRSLDRGRFRGRILKPWAASRGYLYVGLGKKKRSSVHRLVCLAFHGEPASGRTDVAHNDGDLLNNRQDNLRWATRAENFADSIRHGTTRLQQFTSRPLTVCRGQRNGLATLTEESASEILRKWRAKEAGMTSLAREFGVAHETVRRLIRRISWSHLD